jgi:hypothetical protein
MIVAEYNSHGSGFAMQVIISQRLGQLSFTIRNQHKQLVI